MRRFAPLLLLALVAACSTTTEASDVDWSKYPDGTWTRTVEADCGELQELFDAFDDMDAAIRKRHGEGTGDILDYLDDQMAERGCY